MDEQYVDDALVWKCPTVDEVMGDVDHHLALACRLGHMMTAAMTAETEDITLATVHAAAAAGDNLKSIYKSCVLRNLSLAWNLSR